MWHAAPDGEYSGFGAAGAGTAFLRGTQVADRNGIVEFGSLYPGWYRGAHRARPREGAPRGQHAAHHPAGVRRRVLRIEVFAAEPYAAGASATPASDNDRAHRRLREQRHAARAAAVGDGTLALAVIGVDPSGGGWRSVDLVRYEILS